MIEKLDKNNVPLEARLNAAPELNASLSCKSEPIICFGSFDKCSIASNFVK
jgi:hypothetical protein